MKILPLLSILLIAAPLWSQDLPPCKADIRKCALHTWKLMKAKGVKPSEVLGCTHSGAGKYHFTTKCFLAEGADAVETVGFHVIKLWFGHPITDGRSYQWNSTWDPSIRSMTELAKTADFKEVFARRQFDVIVLEACDYTQRGFKPDMDEVQTKALQTEFEDLVAYLLRTYAGTGKTFILQNWEADNAMHLTKHGKETWEQRIGGMIRVTKAKQAGVAAARQRVGEHGVHVLQAFEMNWVPCADEKFSVPVAVNAVVPEVVCDRYSISSWFTKVAGHEAALEEKLNLMRRKAPEDRKALSRFMVGEYGAPESIYQVAKNSYPELAGDTGAAQMVVTQRQVEAALRFGAAPIIYWEIYSNELRKNVVPRRGVNAVNEEAQGDWLVRADGSKAPAWHYFHELFRLEKEEK